MTRPIFFCPGLFGSPHLILGFQSLMLLYYVSIESVTLTNHETSAEKKNTNFTQDLCVTDVVFLMHIAMGRVDWVIDFGI